MKTTNYIIIREENIVHFTSKVLNQMSDYYSAQVILMTKDKTKASVGVTLNDKLIIFPYVSMTSAKARILSQDRSCIFLSSGKNFLESVPTIHRNTRAMIGLGVGANAIFIRVADKKKFEYRNLTMKKGYCVNDGIKFTGKGQPSRIAAEAAVWGDLHEYTHDKEMFVEFSKYSKMVGAKEIILHDVFDGKSINHHELHSSLFIINKIATGVSLQAELDSLANTLNKIARSFSKVTVVESNHDQFLSRIIKDNTAIEQCAELDKILLYKLKVKIMELILAQNRKHVDLKIALDLLANPKVRSNVSFNSEDNIQTVANFVTSLHGSKGPNGAKFSAKSTTLQKSITGHTHSAGFYDDNIVVGHCTQLSQQHYAKGGLSSWSFALATIYKNETAQLIMFFK